MKLSARSKLVKPAVTLALAAKAQALRAQGIDLANFTASGVTGRTTWFSSWGGAFTDGHYGYLAPFTVLGSPDGADGLGRVRERDCAGVGRPARRGGVPTGTP